MATATAKSTDVYLRPHEAAEVLRISERHLRELTKGGTIPVLRLSPRTLRYRRVEIEHLVAGRPALCSAAAVLAEKH